MTPIGDSMKKDIRLTKELYFINNRVKFNLRDLMDEFSISKSTALRDISSLEEIGVPLYAEYGKNGGYQVINQHFLPPVYFSDDEVFSIFFAMQMLAFFITTPFQSEYDFITKKLIESLPDNQKNALNIMKKRLSFNGSPQHYPTFFLKELLLYSMNQNVVQISYQKKDLTLTKRWIQPLGLEAMDGKWYCNAFDFEKNDYRIFRCDLILELTESKRYVAKDFADFDIRQHHFKKNKSQAATEFTVQLTTFGVERFNQRHYPNMSLVEEKGDFYIQGWFEPHELNFMVDYLITFGDSAKIIAPQNLIALYKDKLKIMLSHYQ